MTEERPIKSGRKAYRKMPFPIEKKKADKRREQQFWVHLRCPEELRTMKALREFFQPYKLLEIQPKKNRVKIKFARRFVARQALISRQARMDQVNMQLVRDSKTLLDALPEVDESRILMTGRLFVRNLPFDLSEEDFQNHFSSFGSITEVTLAHDGALKRGKGFGFITFKVPQDAVAAKKALNFSMLKERKIQISAGESPPQNDAVTLSGEAPNHNGTDYQAKKLRLEQASGQLGYKWNQHFISSEVVAEIVARRSDMSLAQFYQQQMASKKASSLSTELALAEVQIVGQLRRCLLEHGIQPERLAVRPVDWVNPRPQCLSGLLLLCKNLPVGSTEADLRALIPEPLVARVQRLVMMPFGVAALLSCDRANSAKRLFKTLNNINFKERKLLVQWVESLPDDKECVEESKADSLAHKEKEKEALVEDPSSCENKRIKSCKLIVRNIPFSCEEADILPLFQAFGNVLTCRMPRNSCGRVRGYAFIEFETPDISKKVVDEMVSVHIHGRAIKVEFADS